MKYTDNDKGTIFGLSSGQGISAVAIFRISGPRASRVFDTLVSGGLPPARQAVVRDIWNHDSDRLIDKGLILWLPGPGSFTGEDMVELQVHGGPAIGEAISDMLGDQGFRLAEAGEFTRRAFQNNKLDLVEVEGLADLLQAESEEQRHLAMFHMNGNASVIYEGWRAGLLAALAQCEAVIDFIEEEEVTDAVLCGVQPGLIRLRDEITVAVNDAGRGERLRQGPIVVITGPPNAGKSSLLNAMAKREAAIVSEVPGTTRDAIEVRLIINGMPVCLVDTAGLRDKVESEIEQIGINRARDWMARADLVIDLVPADQETGGKLNVDSDSLRILSKADLIECESQTAGFDHTVSVKRGEGIEELSALIGTELTRTLQPREPALISRHRHREALQDVLSSLNNALAGPDLSLELQVEWLRLAARSLGRLTGRIDVEDVLGEIFSAFCIGK